MIAGENISLRAPEPSDVDMMFLWENDATAWVDGRVRAPMSRQALWDYVANYDADILAAGQGRFVIVANQTPVGIVDLFNIDVYNRRAEIGIYIDRLHRHLGYGSEAIGLLYRYAMDMLGLHQLSAIVLADNIASRRTFEKASFTTSGRLRSWVRTDSRHYTDALLYQRLLN